MQTNQRKMMVVTSRRRNKMVRSTAWSIGYLNYHLFLSQLPDTYMDRFLRWLAFYPPMYASITGELEFIFQALGNLVKDNDLEDAIARRLLEMAMHGHLAFVLAQSLSSVFSIQLVALSVIFTTECLFLQVMSTFWLHLTFTVSPETAQTSSIPCKRLSS